MPAKKLKEYLDGKGVHYISIQHSPAYTAQQIAASAHVKGRNLAKTVIIKLDGALAMAVLPAKCRVDLKLLQEVTGCRTAQLAEESEFTDRFPGCETGAMPPFGNLYGLPVYADETLTADKEIAFNAGSHSELIQLACADFQRLVEPKVYRFSYLEH